MFSRFTFDRSFLAFITTAMVLSGCGASGPVKATKDIKAGEKFFENWAGSTVGKSDSIVLLTAYSSRDIPAGQEIKPSDVMAPVSLDIEWCKDTVFRNGKDSSLQLKLSVVNGSDLVQIERSGKVIESGTWSLEQKDANAYLSMKLKGKEPVELVGEKSLTGDLRMLNTQAASGQPDQFWIEEKGPDDQPPKQSESVKRSGGSHRRKH